MSVLLLTLMTMVKVCFSCLVSPFFFFLTVLLVMVWMVKHSISGGTFALYSLLCKNANIGILKPKNTDSKTLPDNSRNIESKSWLQTFIEENLIFQRVLLFIAILGMCMLIGDGILTPAISGILGMLFCFMILNSC